MTLPSSGPAEMPATARITPERPCGGASELEFDQLRRLEIASMVEATTLLVLVCVAVPLKHLAHWPLGVKVMGPLHGLAFAAYVWTVIETVSGGGWKRRDAARLFLVAFLPFGGFANLPFLRRQAGSSRRERA